MKAKLFLLIVSVFLMLIAFSSTKAQTDLTKLKYFMIEANIADDSLFIKVQKDMEIEPLMGNYILIVNYTSDIKKNQYIIMGEENDNTAIRMYWNDMSKEVRDGLIAWSKPNKKEMKK
jgi:hypothetical protein